MAFFSPSSFPPLPPPTHQTPQHTPQTPTAQNSMSEATDSAFSFTSPNSSSSPEQEVEMDQQTAEHHPNPHPHPPTTTNFFQRIKEMLVVIGRWLAPGGSYNGVLTASSNSKQSHHHHQKLSSLYKSLCESAHSLFCSRRHRSTSASLTPTNVFEKSNAEEEELQAEFVALYSPETRVFLMIEGVGCLGQGLVALFRLSTPVGIVQFVFQCLLGVLSLVLYWVDKMAYSAVLRHAERMERVPLGQDLDFKATEEEASGNDDNNNGTSAQDVVSSSSSPVADRENGVDSADDGDIDEDEEDDDEHERHEDATSPIRHSQSTTESGEVFASETMMVEDGKLQRLHKRKPSTTSSGPSEGPQLSTDPFKHQYARGDLRKRIESGSNSSSNNNNILTKKRFTERGQGNKVVPSSTAASASAQNVPTSSANPPKKVSYASLSVLKDPVLPYVRKGWRSLALTSNAVGMVLITSVVTYMKCGLEPPSASSSSTIFLEPSLAHKRTFLGFPYSSTSPFEFGQCSSPGDAGSIGLLIMSATYLQSVIASNYATCYRHGLLGIGISTVSLLTTLFALWSRGGWALGSPSMFLSTSFFLVVVMILHMHKVVDRLSQMRLIVRRYESYEGTSLLSRMLHRQEMVQLYKRWYQKRAEASSIEIEATNVAKHLVAPLREDVHAMSALVDDLLCKRVNMIGNGTSSSSKVGGVGEELQEKKGEEQQKASNGTGGGSLADAHNLNTPRSYKSTSMMSDIAARTSLPMTTTPSSSSSSSSSSMNVPNVEEALKELAAHVSHVAHLLDEFKDDPRKAILLLSSQQRSALDKQYGIINDTSSGLGGISDRRSDNSFGDDDIDDNRKGLDDDVTDGGGIVTGRGGKKDKVARDDSGIAYGQSSLLRAPSLSSTSEAANGNGDSVAQKGEVNSSFCRPNPRPTTPEQQATTYARDKLRGPPPPTPGSHQFTKPRKSTGVRSFSRILRETDQSAATTTTTPTKGISTFVFPYVEPNFVDIPLELDNRPDSECPFEAGYERHYIRPKRLAVAAKRREALEAAGIYLQPDKDFSKRVARSLADMIVKSNQKLKREGGAGGVASTNSSSNTTHKNSSKSDHKQPEGSTVSSPQSNGSRESSSPDDIFIRSGLLPHHPPPTHAAVAAAVGSILPSGSGVSPISSVIQTARVNADTPTLVRGTVTDASAVLLKAAASGRAAAAGGIGGVMMNGISGEGGGDGSGTGGARGGGGSVGNALAVLGPVGGIDAAEAAAAAAAAVAGSRHPTSIAGFPVAQVMMTPGGIGGGVKGVIPRSGSDIGIWTSPTHPKPSHVDAASSTMSPLIGSSSSSSSSSSGGGGGGGAAISTSSGLLLQPQQPATPTLSRQQPLSSQYLAEGELPFVDRENKTTKEEKKKSSSSAAAAAAAASSASSAAAPITTAQQQQQPTTSSKDADSHPFAGAVARRLLRGSSSPTQGLLQADTGGGGLGGILATPFSSVGGGGRVGPVDRLIPSFPTPSLASIPFPSEFPSSLGTSLSTSASSSTLGTTTAPGGGAKVSYGLHVLIVDDEAVNRKIAGRMCERLGCTWEGIEDGDVLAQALVLSDRPFDVILLDIIMKRSNGIEVCRALRDQHVYIPIIAATANYSPREAGIYRAAGFTRVLQKPFNQRDLAAALTQALGIQLGRRAELF